MSDYAYLFADILTNKVIGEWPCYGTSFSRVLSQQGQMTATVPLNIAGIPNREILNSTIPGKHALYAVREGGIAWGGPIWSRTYSSDSRGISLTGQSWESWPYKFYPTQHLNYVGIDQRNVVRGLFQDMALVPLQNAQFTLPDTFSNGVVRTEHFVLSDVQSYGDLIEYMTQYDDGFDYEIVCEFDSAGDIVRRVRLGWPQLGRPLSESGLQFEFPGSIIRYTYSENASQSALRMLGIGAGDGAAMLRTTVDQTDLINSGVFPLLQQVYTNKDVRKLATLKSQTTQAGKAARTPIVKLSCEVDPQLQPKFGTWNLGDHMWLAIDDNARFEQPIEQDIRVIGWSLTPSSSENKESLRLVLEGGDEGGE